MTEVRRRIDQPRASGSKLALVLLATLIGSARAQDRFEVAIDWPGADAFEVEAVIGADLEAAIARIPGVRSVRSLSVPGRFHLTVLVAPESDPSGVRARVEETLASGLPVEAIAHLPPVADPLGRAVAFWFEPGGLDPADARRRFQTATGVADVLTPGAGTKTRIELDRDRLAAHGLSVSEVVAALTRAHALDAAAAGAVVVRSGEAPILVRDVATFRSETAIPGLLDGRPVQAGLVRMRPGADPAALRSPEERIRLLDWPLAHFQIDLPDGAAGTGELLEALDRAARIPPVEHALLLRMDAVHLFLRFAPGTPVDEGARAVLASLASFPGVRAFPESIPGSKGRWVDVAIAGPEMDVLVELATRAAGIAAGLEGVGAVRVTGSVSAPELTIRPDLERLAELGIEARDVIETTRAHLLGIPVGREIEVWLGGGPGSDVLADLAVPTSSGELVPLSAIASVERVVGARLLRWNGRRVAGARLWATSEAPIEETLERNLELPAGYAWVQGVDLE